MGATHGRVLCKPEKEPVYQVLLRRDIKALCIPDEVSEALAARRHIVIAACIHRAAAYF